MIRPILVVCLLTLVPVSTWADQNWPQFRGNAGATAPDNPNLPERWSGKDNVVWSIKIEGRGWSCPVVWGNKVFVTSFVNTNTAKPRKGLYITDLQGKKAKGETRWLVHCFDFKTGKQLWKRTAYKGNAKTPIHIKNTYASETPITDGKRVYAYFGNLGLFCFDTNGKKLWEKRFQAYPMKSGWGTGSSPTLHKGKIYIVNDNEKNSFLVAIDAKTGDELWRTSRDEKSNWSTPYIWENSLRTEIVTSGSGKARSYDLDGNLLWELGGMSIITIPTPSAANGLLYLSSGYVLWPRRPVYAIKPGAKGDISLKGTSTKSKYIEWTQRTAASYHPSPVVYKGYIYVLLDRGFLSCYDAKTGKAMYEKKRLPARAFTSSPWAYNDCIFCLNEDGETFVIKAGPKFEGVARNSLDGQMTLSTPAIANDSLLIRTNTKLYRISNRNGKQ